MISYAQNAEDVVLARALPESTGFYVDVGAGHPEIASVTKHFYDLGWRGINIEPRSAAIQLLDEHRPRDINLRLAAGASDGTIDLYVVDTDADLSTTDADDVEFLRERGYQFAVETVPVRTLDRILEEHGVTTTDFLKIDVEGGEGDVLAGIDLGRWNPRVVVVETIKPYSHERTDAGWRSILEAQGYREACFDGVNLFFARDSDVDVAAALVPASALDDYEPAAMTALRTALDELRDYVSKLEEELRRHRELEKEVGDYVAKLEAGVQPSPGVAPVIDLTNPLAGHLASRAARPPASARLAIIGTPRSGGSWIRQVLTGALAAEPLPVAHPADLDWEQLPDRFVLQLHWPRSRFLARSLREHDIAVISAARHPLDVLLSILESAQRARTGAPWVGGRDGDETTLRGAGARDLAFFEWASSRRARLLLALTPEWWSTPATHQVRYEALAADPITGFATLLEQCELDAEIDAAALATDDSPLIVRADRERAEATSRSTYAWRDALDAKTIDALMDAYYDVALDLGYDPNDRVPA